MRPADRTAPASFGQLPHGRWIQSIFPPRAGPDPAGRVLYRQLYQASMGEKQDASAGRAQSGKRKGTNSFGIFTVGEAMEEKLSLVSLRGDLSTHTGRGVLSQCLQDLTQTQFLIRYDLEREVSNNKQQWRL
jgi:hypothetical protein